MACFSQINEEFRAKLDAEITEFRNSYKEKTIEETYNDWHVISFYENYYNLLADSINDIEIDVICWLNGFKRPLMYLYNEWLSCDYSISDSFDDMVDWIEGLYQKEEDDYIPEDKAIDNLRKASYEHGYYDGYIAAIEQLITAKVLTENDEEKENE